MSSNDIMYMVIGLILALLGFGYYTIEVWKAYNDEKRKIKEDFQLSQKYEPEKAAPKVFIFIAVGAEGIVYLILLMTLLMIFSQGKEDLQNSIALASKFIMLMGATVLVVDISRIFPVKEAVRDISYQVSIPKNIMDEITNEKDMQKRWNILLDYYEKENLHKGAMNFGKHTILTTIVETMLMYILLINILLLVSLGLIGKGPATVTDISAGFATNIFMAGVLYILLCIPSIFFMKKCAEISMENNGFVKKILMASYALSLPTIGLVIMIYAMLPLLY
jgi:hypothetical protein